MLNLKFLNEALGKIASDEFVVLYVIANNPRLQKEGRTRIHREVIAEILGWLDDERPQYALKKVTKITNSLVEKGWLKKDVVYETTQKSVNYYSLSKQKIEQKTPPSKQKIEQNLPPSRQKSVPLNKTEKDLKKHHNTEKEEIRVFEEYEDLPFK